MRLFPVLSALGIFLSLFLVSHLIGQVPLATPTPDLTPASAAPSPSPSPVFRPPGSLESHFIQHVFHDQIVIWTAPFHPSNYNKDTVIPAALIMTGLFASDRYTSSWVSSEGELPEISRAVSHLGQGYATLGTAAAFYAAGRLTHNPKARETGILSLESLVDTGIVTEVLKTVSRRQRPNTDEHFGEFIDGGTSFPSGHSSSVWSVATVIAYEYKSNPWIKYGAIAAATAVSLSRYTGRNHFLSDIAAGSAAGFLIGRYVFREYHNPNIDQPKARTTTWLHPAFLPYYDGRSRSYGGSLVWHL